MKTTSRTSSMTFFGEKIKNGELVVFPTETVYGIGANALNPEAVKKIFVVKGRPADNPLIVHVASFADVEKYTKVVTPLEKELFERFSPGPLTVLLPKKNIIPDIVTGGSALVGMRIPSNLLAQALLREAGVPIAAPSANKSGKPSSTHHSHVRSAFGEEVPYVIKGGYVELGLESTVVRVLEERIIILREGAITKEDFEKAFPNNEVIVAGSLLQMQNPTPGTKYKHYSPKARITLLPLLVPEELSKYIEELPSKERQAVLCSDEVASLLSRHKRTILSLGSQQDLRNIAKNLYGVLLQCDKLGIEYVLAQSFPLEGIGRTIMERLRRASSLE